MSTLERDEYDVSEVLEAVFRGHPCVFAGDGLPVVDVRVDAWSVGDATDLDVVRLCRGPTLDVGCGPGRMAELLVARGTPVLGIDVVAEAVRLTRARGVPALVHDVFDRLPDEGRWQTVLLADGNLGIGGDPVALLRRLHRALAPGGRVVADVAPPGTGVGAGEARLTSGGRTSAPFRWAVVGACSIAEVAREAGFAAVHHHVAGRDVAVLVREDR